MATQTAPSNFPVRVLRSNSLVSGISGLAMLLAAGPLATLFGLSTTSAFTLVGLVAFGFALWLVWRIRHRPLPRRTVLVVALLDSLWVVISVVGLLTNEFQVTTEGKWLILFASDIVGVFAVLEFYGWWRMKEKG